MEKFKFIDLFCGIGGFHQAMTSLGGECVFASDIDPFCQQTYFKNYGIMPIGDITKVDAADIPAHDVLCAGFPCQSFSIAGKRLGFNDPTKGTLFFDIMRIAKHHRPKYMLLENVRNLASHDNGNTWRVIHESLVQAGYNVSPTPVIFSPHFIGIPQRRDRVFIMCVRKDVGELPEFYFNKRKAKPCSIYSVLQDDSEIENIQHYRLRADVVMVVEMWNEFLKEIRRITGKCPLFAVTDLFLKPSTSDFNYDQLTELKAVTARRNVQLYNKAPEYISDWLKKANQLRKFKGSRRILEYHAGQVEDPDLWETVIQFRQSGIRARNTHHFPTLTAVAMTPIIGRLKRKLTPRECARLQSFPDTFIYDENETQAYKQFGNSVNVDVVRMFAKFLLGDPEVQAQFTRTQEDIEAEMREKYGDPNAPRRKRGRPRKNPVDPNQPPRKRGRPRKVYDAPLLPLEGVEIPPEVPASVILNDPTPPPPPRKRGRPRKNPLPVALDENGNPLPVELGPDGLPRRKRGRPRKVVDPDANPPKKRGRPRKVVEPGVAPKKRGRPRKDATVQVAPKKRGRPRKDATLQPVPKKRGRPRKNPEPLVQPKKRGRPRKNPLP